METEKPLAIHVYRELLEQATIFRQTAKKKSDEEYTLSDKEHYEGLAQELYHWAMRLELTPEINPPKNS